jgi:alkylation response protein AidB-like acyl-CoA dehydrogenase
MAKPVDSTSPTLEELLVRVADLHPLLREHAAAADANRRTADEVIAAMTSAGFFRLFTPARFGGFQTDLRTAFEVCQAIAVADASAGWLLGVGAIGAFVVAQGSEQVQQDVFGATPDVLMAGGLTVAPARRVAGGIRVSGRWGYASGSPHAKWAAISANVVNGDGSDQYYCVAPVSDVRLEDTWYTVGMRGTASNTWVGDDVFVPEHRMISMASLLAGRVLDGKPHSGSPLPFVPVGSLLLLPAILGAGSAALGLVLDKAGTKPIQYTSFAHQSDSVGTQLQIGDAELKLRTARLFACQVADELDRFVRDGSQPETADRARYKAMCAYASRQVIKALSILLDVHGAGSFAETNPMQRYWRDANTAARHAGLNYSVAAEVYGKDLLGIEEAISPMV